MPWLQGPTHRADSSTRKPLSARPFGYSFLSCRPGAVPIRDSCCNARFAALFLSGRSVPLQGSTNLMFPDA